MEQQQRRFFKIIGITSERALSDYNIPPITCFLDTQCQEITQAILNDPSHVLTQKQPKKQQHHNTRSAPYTIKEGSKRYQNSFFQKGTRWVRDGYEMSSLISIRTPKNQRLTLQNTRCKLKTNCRQRDTVSAKITPQKSATAPLVVTTVVQPTTYIPQTTTTSTVKVQLPQCGDCLMPRGIAQHVTKMHYNK